MTTLSRRHLVTTAAVLPALAIPALASEAIGPNHPDAELIALGDELQRLSPGYLASIAATNSDDDLISDAAWPEYEAIDRETCELAEKIIAVPARTLAGLRVKAIVAIHSSWFLWDKPFDDLDWDQKGARALMEAVCSVTGLDAAEMAAAEMAARSWS
jgi:hypothetical protein